MENQDTQLQDEIRQEMARLKKILKRNSKNELIAILMNTLLQLTDMRNGMKVILEENKALKGENGAQNGEQNA